MLSALFLLALQSSAGADWQHAREAALELPIPAVTVENLEDWRRAILPRAGERDWESIPWITSFAEGIRRADAEQRPLLFWAMNGHPLGCT